MKTLFKLCFFLTLAMLFTLSNLNKMNAQTYDWTLVTPLPCNSDQYHPWDGPHEKHICGDELADIGYFGGDPNCCYTIIYYYRWTGQGNKDFELNIVGVFYDPYVGTGCDQYTSINILVSAYIVILTDYSRIHSEFKTNCQQSDRQSQIGQPLIYTYVTSKCDGDGCSSFHGCCRYIAEIFFGGYGVPDYAVTAWNCDWDLPYTVSACPSPCTILCNTVASGVNPDPCLMCDDDWDPTENSGSFVYNCCTCSDPNCSGNGCSFSQIQITYKYKAKTDPATNCTYHDYELESWDMGVNICSSSDFNAIHAAIISNMLANGYFRPGLNQTITDIRVTEAQCYRPEKVWIGIYQFIRWTLCPENIYCCKSIWQVQNIYNVITSLRLQGGTSPGELTCSQDEITDGDIDANICHTFCSPQEVIIKPTSVNNQGLKNLSSNFMTSIKPNPGKNNFEMQINSTFIGIIELRIYNTLGEVILSQRLNKNSVDFEQNVEINNYPIGVYYYQLYVEEKPVTKLQIFFNE